MARRAIYVSLTNWSRYANASARIRVESRAAFTVTVNTTLIRRAMSRIITFYTLVCIRITMSCRALFRYASVWSTYKTRRALSVRSTFSTTAFRIFIGFVCRAFTFTHYTHLITRTRYFVCTLLALLSVTNPIRRTSAYTIPVRSTYFTIRAIRIYPTRTDF